MGLWCFFCYLSPIGLLASKVVWPVLSFECIYMVFRCFLCSLFISLSAFLFSKECLVYAKSTGYKKNQNALE